MRFSAFLRALLIPFGCWLLALFAMRDMRKACKNLLSALTLCATVAVMIALSLLRLAAPTGFRYSANVAPCAVTLTLCGGVGIFLRAWSLYSRDRLSAGEIAPYWVSGFLILSGAVTAFCLVCF